ncbi:MAG: DinB family protein [Thermomicrobiales bacterium]
MNDILVACFEHNRWANLLLAEACLAVDPALLEIGLEGTFGPIRATLLHTAIAEWAYARALAGEAASGVPRLASGETDLAVIRAMDMAAIRDELAGSGDAMIAAARTAVAGATIQIDWDGDGVWRPAPVAFLFVQALDHAKEHRTQVAAILTQQGVTPPEMDAWASFGM